MSKEILKELAAWREDGGTAEDQMLHRCYLAIKQLESEMKRIVAKVNRYYDEREHYRENSIGFESCNRARQVAEEEVVRLRDAGNDMATVLGNVSFAEGLSHEDREDIAEVRQAWHKAQETS